MKAPPTATPDPRHSTEYVSAWRVPSSRHAHVTYVVRFDRLTNEWFCQCEGYHFRGHCAHIDRALDAFVAEARAGRGRVAS